MCWQADKKGIPPLSAMITAANTQDMEAATEILNCIVTKKDPVQRKRNNNKRIYVCLDKGYKQLSTDRT